MEMHLAIEQIHYGIDAGALSITLRQIDCNMRRDSVSSVDRVDECCQC